MGGSSLTARRIAALAAILAFGVLLLALLPGLAVLFAPTLLISAVLVLGFSPGEQLIERLRQRRTAPRAMRAPRTLPLRHVAVVVGRTSWLPASALAMRPPPGVPALTS